MMHTNAYEEYIELRWGVDRESERGHGNLGKDRTHTSRIGSPDSP
jgi:hypothetical protein